MQGWPSPVATPGRCWQVPRWQPAIISLCTAQVGGLTSASVLRMHHRSLSLFKYPRYSYLEHVFIASSKLFFTVVLGGSSLTEIARLNWAILFACLARLHSLSEHYHSFLYDLSMMLSLRIRWSLGYVEHGYWIPISTASAKPGRSHGGKEHLLDGFSIS